ncbi:MAG: ribokinase [Pseudomonadota bacterium]
MTAGTSITVVGSVNLDLVATGEALPAPGETVTGATYAEYPGGKGANQALAARRLGASISLIARTGPDANAEAALSLLNSAGVDLSECQPIENAATGVALIAVSADGENQIIVAPGANAALTPSDIPPIKTQATLAVLEVPVETAMQAALQTENLFAINLAPALSVPDDLIRRADLIIVNEGEAAVYGDQLEICPGLIAITYGARGAALFRSGEKIAEAAPPIVTAIDTTGAGDTFSAALTTALCEGMDEENALRFACRAGALATTQRGAQPSFPTRADIDRLDS